FVHVPLDPNLPLWEAIIIYNYSKGFIICLRGHHCIGDGMSFSAVLSKITDDGELLEDEIEVPHYQSSILFKIVTAILLYAWIFFGFIKVLFKWIWLAMQGSDPLTVFKNGNKVSKFFLPFMEINQK